MAGKQRFTADEVAAALGVLQRLEERFRAMTGQ